MLRTHLALQESGWSVIEACGGPPPDAALRRHVNPLTFARWLGDAALLGLFVGAKDCNAGRGSICNCSGTRDAQANPKGAAAY